MFFFRNLDGLHQAEKLILYYKKFDIFPELIKIRVISIGTRFHCEDVLSVIYSSFIDLVTNFTEIRARIEKRCIHVRNMSIFNCFMELSKIVFTYDTAACIKIDIIRHIVYWIYYKIVMPTKL